MKRECKKIQDKIIDIHYNELSDNAEVISHIENCSDCYTFKKNLKLTLNYMDTLDIDMSDLQVNIAEIIEKAEQIRNKRKDRLELLIFITTSIIFLISSVLFMANLDVRLLLYTQIFLYFNLPLILIPFYKLKTSRR
ncbi:zf-HC2 domain-containing protein [Thermoanaerobacter indiensis]|uniref:zf-HC2 domain-containing protein n=1 Tax=Thermoanaerobacter indiensis TaxID=1125974 RepID=UPI00037D87E5|nr:zf-HC2 domain-containing protein [Thermoanaerobacter indiensis]